MKLTAFLLSLLTALMPAAALIRGPKLVAWLPVSSTRELLGWSLIGSALCLALLTILFLDAILGQSRLTVLADQEGKIRQIGDAGREGGKAA